MVQSERSNGGVGKRVPQNLKRKIRAIHGFESVEGTSHSRNKPRRLLRIRLRNKDECEEMREAAFED